MYPPALQDIIDLFSSLSEIERREMLVSYAEAAICHQPKEGDHFDLEDVRKDEECTDTVGIFLNVNPNGGAHFCVSLGGEVQTLTRAMASILCNGLEGSTPQEITDIPSDFIQQIVGQELVRQRSQTVYYILSRVKSISKVWLSKYGMK